MAAFLTHGTWGFSPNGLLVCTSIFLTHMTKPKVPKVYVSMPFYKHDLHSCMYSTRAVSAVCSAVLGFVAIAITSSNGSSATCHTSPKIHNGHT